MSIDTVACSRYASENIGGNMGAFTIDIDAAKSLYVGERLSTLEVARRVGATPAGVRQALLRAGVAIRPRSKSHEQRTKKALGFVPTKEWLTQAMDAFEGNALACAEHYGFKYVTFVDVLRRHEIDRLAPEDRRNVGLPRVEIPIEEAMRLSTSGVTYEELAQRYGVTYGIITRRMQEAGHVAPKGKQKRYHKWRTLSPPKRALANQIGIECCEICDHDLHLDLAHIKPRREGGPLVKENVLVLCPNHHRSFDRGTLSLEEFSKVMLKVRASEQLFCFQLPFYREW
jgi:hypothetical protein